MGDKYVLDAAWVAVTRKTYKIEFEQAPSEDDHFMFLFTATPTEGTPFIFKASVSPVLVEKLGINAQTEPKRLMKAIAGKGLADLKVRLSAGHDVNFEGLPYIKTYTLRDKAVFQSLV